MKKAPLSSIKEITISDYDYALPPERIAWYPPKERGTSKLLVSTSGHHIQVPFADIGAHLPPKATLVFNETKVVQARMHFTKSSGAHIEIFCLEPLLPVAEVQLAFSQPSPVTWKCLVGNSRRWKQGALETTISVEGRPLTIKATRTAQHEGYSEITFHWDNETMPFGRVLESIGTMPLPPYIHREAEPEDQERYQTVYARNDGSVAAPTAGLHFTETLLASLEKQGISKEKITLHVGAGTFRPVTSPTLGEHCMHTEQIMVSRQTITRLLQRDTHPIVPVGTTTARTLESLFWYGAKLHLGETSSPYLNVKQWDPYTEKYRRISTEESLKALLQIMEKEKLNYLKGETNLLIAPGYPWHFADALITNFHQPKSTLLLLVSSFVGERWKQAYTYALQHDFRFLSFGDSSLFFP